MFTAFCIIVCVIHAFLTPWVTSPKADTVTLMEVKNSSLPNITMKYSNPLAASLMCFGALMVGAVYVRRDMPSFFEDMCQVDMALSSVSRPNFKNDFRTSVVLIIYFWVLSTPVISYATYFSYLTSNKYDFIWNIILNLENYMSFTSEIQFICLAFFLRERFRTINVFLKKHTVFDAPHVYFFINQNIKPDKDLLTLRQVTLVHKSNVKLCDMMKDLNKIYQIQLLCSTACCFFKILFNVYLAIGKFSIDCKKSWKIFLWSIYYFMRFMVTVISATYTSHEAMKTKNLVARANSRQRSVELKEELALFLNHTTTWSMKFSACGLITVDTKLITSALAAGTTYMVVMVQYSPALDY